MAALEHGQVGHGQIGSGKDSGKVIAMDRFRSGRGLSPIRQAEAYWTALRQDGDIPSRSRVDPRGLTGVLEYAFVLERIAPGLARFRLAGRHLVGLAGMEVRGMPLSAFFTPASRDRIGTLLQKVFDTPAVAELTLDQAPGRARTGVEARMILLPLKSDQDDIDRALGLLIAEGAHTPPCRFDLTAIELRPVGPLQTRQDTTGISAPGFADAQAVLAGKPNLRVVK